MHENRVEFKVYGDYALFSDPITRVGGEKSTYSIPTYEAIKGVLHSVYWKPTIIWLIDDVRVMNQIQMETKGIRPIKYSGGNDLSYYTYLRQVCYQVRAHFIWNENRPELAADRNENKHHEMAKRFIKKGGRRDVFLGTRECQAYVEPCVFGEGEGYYDNVPLQTFGMMLHGITYADEAYSEQTKGKLSVRLWNAKMERGVIHFPKPWEIPAALTRPVREMEIKPFGEGSFVGLEEFEKEFSDGLDAEMLSDI